MNVETNSQRTSEGEAYSRLHYLLHLAFIEIRASEDLAKAQVIADIFHNVPMMMRGHRSIEKIEQEIYEKASRHGFEKHIAGWFRSADRNLRETSVGDQSMQVLKND